MFTPATSSKLPPELMNSDPDGFAWGVWHDRTPRLIAQIRDGLPYGAAQRRALDALWEEISTDRMAPLPAHAHDHQVWARWGAEHFGKRWLDAPFLWSESYFYRRLLDAVGYFEPGAWHGVDPFEPLKTAELRDPALETDLLALQELDDLPGEEQGQAKLLASLWGNRADLGFRIGQAAGTDAPQTQGLVADDSAILWELLGDDATVVVVADNAGRELLADLVLIDHLLEHRHAASVILHLKPHPYYVSDATAADLVACLRRLGQTKGAASLISLRLQKAIAEDRLALGTHDFYCAPWSFHHLPGDLAAQFDRASVTIVKGDLNYRRVVGDREWPPTTPFAQAAAYFPGPVCALRTLKSDAVTGVSAHTVAQLETTAPNWRTDGDHGLVQIRTP